MAKEIKNEERKRKRLRGRAQKLTDTDLLQVMRLRADARATREEGRAAASSSRPQSGRASTEGTAPAGDSRPAGDEEDAKADHRSAEE